MLITYIVNFKKNQKGSGQVENVMNSIFANSANDAIRFSASDGIPQSTRHVAPFRRSSIM